MTSFSLSLCDVMLCVFSVSRVFVLIGITMV